MAKVGVARGNDRPREAQGVLEGVSHFSPPRLHRCCSEPHATLQSKKENGSSVRAAQQNRGRLLRNRQQSESAPSFNAPNIVVAEADDAPCFQTIDFKRRRAVYKSLYAPFVSLLGRHYLDYDHKELPIFVLQAHLVTFSDAVFRCSRDAIGWWH
jgi:hypothetical protein